MAKKLSPAMSFELWSLFEYVKGRKKTLITLIGAALGYVLTSNEVIAIISGGVVEMLFALGEYYFKPVKQ